MQISESMERSLLGLCLLDNPHYGIAAKRIAVQDFALDSHRRIWQRMGAMIAAGRDANYLSLAAELDKNSELSSCGGLAYLASVTEGLPRSKSALRECIRSIEESARLRRAQQI